MPIVRGPVGSASSNVHYRYGPPKTSYQDIRTRGDEVSVLVVDYKLVVSARDGKPVREVDKLGSLISLAECSDN